MHILSRLHLETHHILRTVGHQALHLFARHRERIAHLAACLCVVLKVLYLAALGFQLLGRIESDVSFPVVQQLVYIFFIDMLAFALSIRTVFSAKTHTFVKLNAQPSKGFDDIFLCSGHEALRIGIFNTEHQIATVLTGKEIVVEGRSYASDMQSPCRTGCKAHPYFSFRHVLSVHLYCSARSFSLSWRSGQVVL